MLTETEISITRGEEFIGTGLNKPNLDYQRTASDRKILPCQPLRTIAIELKQTIEDGKY